jgi:hypothetical protein
MTARTLRFAALLLALAQPLRAQLTGRVVDSAERSLPAATVELWSATHRLAVATSDGDGRFTLPTFPDATTVSAHRIGYQTVSLAAPSAAEIVIRLAAAPVLLDGIRASAGDRARCPARDDPRARVLWELARARYRSDQGAVNVRIAAESYEGDAPREGIGELQGLDARRQDYSTESTRRRGVDADGLLYGSYGRLSPVVQSQWEYAPLAWGLNPHFVTGRFGQMHTLTQLAERGDIVVLGFCPRGRGAPAIEGTMTLTRDGILRSARWLYRTPRPRDEAGGEVDYLPPSPATGNLLLARRSLFWRALFGRFHFREDRYTGWEVGGAGR